VVAAYRHDPALALQVVAYNAGELWRTFGTFFAPRLPHAMQFVAAAVFLAALGAGLAALLRRATALVLFLLGYGAIVMCWPYDPTRFACAVWPLFGIILVAAAREVGARGRGRWPLAPRAAALAVALLLMGHAAYVARGFAARWAGAPQRTQTARLWPLVQWTVTNAGARDVVASDGHVMIALYTGRITMPVSMLTPTEHLREKPAPLLAQELNALAVRYRPTLLVLSNGNSVIDAVPLFAGLPSAPSVLPLPPVPGGGSAFALRWRP
jgi:hypothetical protein